jgi:methionine biosynthesis protein MetW
MEQKDLRPDLKHIASLIEKNSHIMEIGCGDGLLLEYLTKNKNIDGRGIELSQKGVSRCVKSGLSVIQGDADEDLQYYPDLCFDYAVSSQVIQATKNPKDVIQQMMRIANKCIIAIPNFGYWYNRYHLTIKGRMPVSKTLSYQWYDTPNIHFSTIKDFEILCKELGYKIEKKIYLQPSGEVASSPWALAFPNFFSEKCVFMIA